MNAMTSVFPFTLRWDSQDLADAVPLRLFELCDFAAADDAHKCANADAVHGRVRRGCSYLPVYGLAARFRVHG